MTKFSWTTLFILVMVALVALAGCGGAQPAQQAAVADVSSLPVDINAQTVDSLRNRDDVVILDVREDYEYAEGHIPGAVLLPLGQIPNRLAEIPKDKTVIAVCRSGNRSNQATQFLRQQGFDNVHNMTGGMNSWSSAGYQVEK
ncbi:MAG: Thiosulfate sulfurtransferase GlpE [Anaerolineae bacterium]|nr:Thiosulfate sulfurtransferase GlpE [Anaerolineae bacterium]